MFENTWKENFSYDFHSRIRLMTSCLNFKKISSIIDVGCGQQDLKKYIPQDVSYCGYDLYQHCKGVKVRDFNNGGTIDDTAQVIFCSGVFEYIYDVEHLVADICRHCEMVVGSYNFYNDVQERNPIWVNSLTRKEFYGMFRKNGFRLKTEFFCGNHRIFILLKANNVSYINKARVEMIKRAIRVPYLKYRFMRCLAKFLPTPPPRKFIFSGKNNTLCEKDYGAH